MADKYNFFIQKLKKLFKPQLPFFIFSIVVIWHLRNNHLIIPPKFFSYPGSPSFLIYFVFFYINFIFTKKIQILFVSFKRIASMNYNNLFFHTLNISKYKNKKTPAG